MTREKTHENKKIWWKKFYFISLSFVFRFVQLQKLQPNNKPHNVELAGREKKFGRKKYSSKLETKQTNERNDMENKGKFS